MADWRHVQTTLATKVENELQHMPGQRTQAGDNIVDLNSLKELATECTGNLKSLLANNFARVAKIVIGRQLLSSVREDRREQFAYLVFSLVMGKRGPTASENRKFILFK